MPSGPVRWFGLLLVWLIACTGYGAVVTVTETSEPNGLVTKSTLTNAGTTYTSTSAVLDQVGNRFAYWKINGERQVDSVGRAANPVVFTPTADTTLVAVYLPAAQDLDADGIPDWFEYEYFGDLTKDQMADSDADQLSVAVEILFGTHPLLVNAVNEGGLSRRGSGVFLAKLDAGFYPVTMLSDPAGIIEPVVKMVTGSSSVTVPTPPDSLYGYRFAGWYFDGARLDSPLTLQPATIPVTWSINIVAKYIPETQDLDGDGIADWLEWFVSSGTSGDGSSDIDADSFSLALELVLGYSPNAKNQIVEGGLARRESGVFQANLAGLLSLTIRSDPQGLVTETKVWRASGELAETQEIWDSLINGYRFVGWRLDGVDVRESWGASKPKVSTTLAADSVAVARFVLETQDDDTDGIPDWLEWLYGGALTVSSGFDADADGVPWSVESILGWHPGIVNTVVEGGLSRRSSHTGNFILNWQPSITQQLMAVQGSAGLPASLSISVTGPGPFTYEWRKNGEVLPQVAGDAVSFPSLSVADAGRYQVKVTNAYGSMQSNAVLVMVDGLPVITRQPAGASSPLGSSRVMGVEVDGNGPFSYQWRKGAVSLTGATSATLSFPSIQLSDSGTYDVMVSNAAGAVTSLPAELVVEAAPALNGGQSGLVQRALGNTLNLQGGTATGSGPLAFQWFKDGVPLRTGTSLDLALGAAQAWMNGTYWLRVSNASGWVEGPRIEVSVSGTSLATAVGMKGWGTNTGGTMGDAGPSGDVARPLWGTFWGAGKFRSISTGERHGAAVDDVGDVFVWGAGESGQLGLGAGVTTAAAPTKVTLPEPAVQVAVGSAHTVAVMRSGSIYVWGANDVGQLGIGTAGSGSFVPVNVATGGARVFSVATSGNATFALNERGEIHAWGANTGGWLGSQVAAAWLATPVRIEGALVNKRVRSVVAGGTAVYALTDEGTLLGWGSNDKGQLAGAQSVSVADPVVVLGASGSKVLAVAAGGAHALALMSDGSVMAWGDGARGQLGNGATTGSGVPVAVDLSALNGASVSMVGAGGVRSVMATLDGKLWVWGGAATDVSSPTLMPISSGAVNRLAVSERAVHVWWREAKEVTVPPVSVGVLAGGSVGLRGYQSVPGGVVRYQWRREVQQGGALADIVGQVGNELVFNNVDAAMAGNYALEVYGSTGRAVSELVTLEVVSGPPAVPVVTPAELAFVNGGSFNIPFSYVGIYVPSFQWKLNGVELVGATSKSLMGTGFGSQKTGTYSVVVTNPFGSVERAVANVSLAQAPVIAVQPVGGYRRAGTAVGLSVTASGVPSPSYQWKRNGVDLAGQTESVLSLPNFGVADEGSYSVVVTNLAGNVVSSSAQLGVAIAPEITIQPLGRYVLPSANITMQVVATGTPTPSYQWRKGGALIAGATGAQLAINGYAAADAGDYTVEVMNVGGSVTSGVARLQTGSVPVIGVQPVSQMPVMGGNVTLSVGASGVPTPTYQWKKNGVMIGGATGAQYVVTGYQTTDAGNYAVVVSNEVGSVESQVAVLGTGSAPVITTQPVSKYVLAGGSVTVGVAAEGIPTPVYQWQRNGVVIGGATGPQLNIASWSEALAGDYTVAVSNANGSVTSGVAKLQTGSVPVIGVQPVSQMPVMGGNVTLSVGASGVPAPTYQWKKNGVMIGGAAGAQYVVTGYQTTDAGNYAVVVSNEVGSVESQVAVLGTGSAPVITTQPASKYVLAGGSVTVGVAAEGMPTPVYQWQRNGVVIGGATGPQLNIASWSEGLAGDYTVVVSNANGSVTSSVAKLQTGSVPVIGTQPVAMTLGYGSTGALSVVAAGVPGVSYQWMKNGATLTGAVGAVLELTGAAGVAGSYKVLVSNVMGSVESAAVAVNYVEPIPVQVTSQPVGGLVVSGGRSVLSVSATGTDLKYQWRKDGVDLVGAVGNELVIDPVDTVREGRYSVRVYNGISEVVSNVAELRLLKPPLVTQALVGGVFAVGSRVVLRVAVQSDEATTFVWKRNGVVVSGAVGPEYLIEESAAVAGRVEYAVEVTNRAGSAVSGPVSIRHLEVPILEKALVGVSVEKGAGASLSVGVNGEELEYVWKRNGVVIAGLQGGTYAPNAVGFEEAGLYSVEVKNAVGKVESGPVGLWVKPRWIAEPTGTVALAGSAVRLRASAEGSGVLAYRWMRNGQWVSGAVGADFEIGAELALEGQSVYRVEVSGSGGVALSREVTVEFQRAVELVERPSDVWVKSGQGAVLGVKAVGSGLKYQWKRNGVELPGAVGPQHALERVGETEAGVYSVVVSNAVSSVEASAAVRIAEMPTIRNTAVERRIAVGGSVDLAVDATGDGVLSYQWYRSGVLLDGARSVTFASGLLSEVGVWDYEVEVRNLAGAVRARVARVVVMAPVKVSVPVSEVSVRAGERLAFGVNASGGEIRYEWRKNGVVMGGQNAAGIEIPAATDLDAGDYVVDVRNDFWSARSSVIRVVIRPAVEIRVQPLGVFVVKGGSASLRVVAEGTGVLSYEWRRNGVAVVGGTTSSLTLPSVAAADAGMYSVLVRNGSGSAVESRMAEIKVGSGFSIVDQPVGTEVGVGGNVSLNVSVSGNVAVGYQWYRGGNPVPGGVGAALRLTGVREEDAGRYKVVVTDGVDREESREVEIRVLPLPVIDRLTGPAQLREGASGVLEVVARSASGMSYQWYKEGVLLAGQVGPRLELREVGLGTGGLYEVEVKNGVGTVRRGLRVEIAGALEFVVQPVGVKVAEGGSVRLNAVAQSGMGTVRYEWQRNGVSIPAVSGSSLEMLDIQPAQGGDYRVIARSEVRGVQVEAVSAVATVLVTSVPRIVRGPEDVTLVEGGRLRISVEATGSGTLEYRWYRDGQEIVGAIGPSYEATEVGVAAQGRYAAEVRNEQGRVRSREAAVVVRPAVRILTQPSAVRVVAGRLGVLTVAAEGESLSYVWERLSAGGEWESMLGQTGTSLTLNAVGSAEAGRYRVRVRSGQYEVVSAVADVVLVEPPTMKSVDPALARVELPLGGRFRMQVDAMGTGPLRVRWLRASDARAEGETVLDNSLFVYEVMDAGRGSGGWYYAEISNEAGRVESSRIEVVVLESVAIEREPVSVTAESGSRAVFSVAAKGGGMLTYQWYRNGLALSGEVRSDLVIGSPRVQDNGLYRVVVSNGMSRVESRDVELRVRERAWVVAQPKGLAVREGSAAVLRVLAGGEGPFGYQWYRGGELVEGAVGPELVIPAVSLRDAGRYRAKVSGVGEVLSEEAVLEVLSAPRIVEAPVGALAVKAGSDLRLSVVAEGSGVLNYQWIRNGAPISGAVGSVYVVTASTLKGRELEFQGGYEVVVTNGYGSIRSALSAVVVEGANLGSEQTARTAPRVDENPVSAKGGPGGVVTLKVVASGDVLRYQWRRGGRDMAGAISSTLAIGPLSAELEGAYDVVVSNSRGTVVSAPAWVTLTAVPQILEQPRSLEGVKPGESAAFLVQATGEGLVYQWRRNGVPMAGADASLIGMPSVREEDEGVYDVKVSNVGGSVTSAPVVLTVRKGVRIAGHPQSRRVASGTEVQLKVSAFGEEPLRYEWYKDGQRVIGTEGPELMLGNLDEAKEGRYTCHVSNALGAVTSAGARVELDSMPLEIVRQPESIEVVEGDSVGLRVDVKGRGPFRYQWYRNGQMIDGEAARMPELLMRDTGIALAGKYFALISNGSRELRSAEALLEVGPRLRITRHPEGGVFAQGDRMELRVEATGTGQMKYQWRRNGQDISGQTGAALVIAPLSVRDAGVYEAVVRTERSPGVVSARVTSAGALVKVEEEARISGGLASRSVNPGDGLRLTVGVTGSGPYEFEWKKDDTIRAGVMGPELVLEKVSAADAGKYSVRVRGGVGGWSEPVSAQIRVNEAVQIVRDLAGGLIEVSAGRGTSLEVRATGSGVVKYQWRRDGQPLARANSQRLALTMMSEGLVGDYDCVISNGFSQVASRSVKLVVRGVLAISKQPAGVEVNPGDGAVFSVELSGASGSERFRWYRLIGKTTEAVPGGVGRVLELRQIKARDEGQYYVVVSGAKVLTSSVARLVVRQAPAVVTQPVPVTVVPGGRLELAVNASGTAPIAYQWQRNGVPVPGAIGAVLRIDDARGADSGLYRVVLTNMVGSAVSNEVPVEVGRAVTIVKQPVGIEVNAGAPLSLKVEAQGSGELRYQWRKDGKDILGPVGQRAELSAARIGVADEGDYDVVVENLATIGQQQVRMGRVVSEKARVSVNRPVVVTRQPLSRGVFVGDPVSFEVGAEGSGLAVQWMRLVGGRYETVPGATGARYTIDSAAPDQAGRYGVVLTGKVNTVRLEGLQLSVTDKLRVVRAPQPMEIDPGEAFALSVEVELKQEGLPLSYRWRRNGSVGILDGQVRQVDVVAQGSGYRGVPQVRFVGGGGSGALARAVMEDDGRGAGTQRVARLEMVSGGKGYTAVPAVEIVGNGSGAAGEVFGGGQGSTLSVSTAREVDDAEYDVMVYAGAEWVSTEPVRVKVRDLVKVERVLSGVVEVLEGGELILDSGVSGVGAQAQWTKDGAVTEGGAGVVYRKAGVSMSDAGAYRARVVGEARVAGELSAVEVGPVVVKVVPRVQFMDAPADVEVQPGSRVELSRAMSPEVEGEGIRYYRWKRGGTVIPGATGRTYVIYGVREVDEGEYTLEVENRAGTVESSPVRLRVNDLPVIVQQPMGVDLDEGQGFVLEALVAGPGLRYQWYRDGVAVEGATAARYAVEESVAGSHDGQWVLRATSTTRLNGLEVAVTSERVRVALRKRTRIEQQPASEGFIGATNGGSLVFGVRASGSGLTYQWERDGQVIPGAVASQYRIEKMGLSLEGVYRVVVRGELGEVSSEPFIVAVEKAPEILEHPKAAEVSPGERLELSARARGSGALRYQWKKNARPLMGQVGSVLQIGAVQATDAGVYECEVSNRSGLVTTMGAIVTVREPVTILEQPMDVVALPGGAATLRVLARGGGEVRYQWRKNGQDLDGANGEVFRISDVSEDDGGTYDVIVTNGIGTVESRPVTVRVPGAVRFSELPESVIAAVGGRVAMGVRISERTALPVRYEWRRLRSGGGYDVVGQNGETLVIDPVTSADGGDYQCVVSNEVGSASTAVAKLMLSTGITLVRQSGPEGMAKQGDSVAFEVEVESALGVTYQWMKRVGGKAEALLGETYSRLVLDGVSGVDAAQYVVVVTDGVNRIESSPMGLTVEDALRVDREPVGARVVTGGRVVLGVEASGDQSLMYQWRKDGRDVLGATNRELVLTGLSSEGIGWYDVRIQGGRGGVIYSRAVPVELVQSVSIRRQPVGVTTGRGNPVALEVEAAGDGPLDYQWLKGGVTLSDSAGVAGARTSRLLIRSALVTDSGVYTVRVNGPAGAVLSQSAPVVVLQSVTVNAGGTVTAAAEGADAAAFLDLAPVKVYEVSAVNGAKVERYEWAVDAVSGMMKWRIAPRVAGQKGGWEEAEKGSWKHVGAPGFSVAERMEWVSVMGSASARGLNQWETSGAAVQSYGSGNTKWLAPVLIGSRVQTVSGKETRWTVTVRYVRAEASFESL